MQRRIQALVSAIVFAIAGAANAATLVYYSVFNIEGESAIDAAFVTYASLLDMLNDQNRTGVFIADGHPPFGTNIVGSGTFLLRDAPSPVSLPGTSWLLGAGLAALAVVRRSNHRVRVRARVQG
jgi:hypothetical protein